MVAVEVGVGFVTAGECIMLSGHLPFCCVWLDSKLISPGPERLGFFHVSVCWYLPRDYSGLLYTH